MGSTLVHELLVFMLAVFVGFQLIAKVPSVLHTPLMSATNAIHGVIVIGALVVCATAKGPVELTIGALGVFFGTLNVVGGYVVTDRMLEMFRSKQRGEKGQP